MHERDLLNAAFEIVDPTARREYLDQACAGNSALLVRVERLLSRAAEAADFLEQPANDLCSDFAAGLLADASKPPLASLAPVGRDDVAPAVGTLFGRYRVERELGSGGMGVVYLAEDIRLGRRVALKIPKFDADGKLHLSERFRREARTMASVQHRNLCPIFDVDEQDGKHYLTMAFIDGEPLSQVIKQGSSLTSRQIAELIRKLAMGLDAAHRAGVVHRDLKPSNVMIDRGGEPILMDFGLAWLVHEADSRVTQTGAIIGTPAYMSPEQAEGDPDKVGAASDIYSLGVILYELIAGRPIRSGSVKQTLFKLMHEAPARPSEVRSGVDPRLEEICCKAISSRPEDRFATAADFAVALAEFPSDRCAVLSADADTIVYSTAQGERQESVSGTALAAGFSSRNINSTTPVASTIPLTASVRSRIALVSLLLVGVLGAVWATIEQQRKGETSKSIVAIPSNPTSPTKSDAPTRPAGDGQVENLPHEIVPAKPQVPADPGKPFVVVRDGKDVRTLKTMVAAINELQPGDVIEIRSNERLPIQFVEPVIKPLAIRAGAGYRPLLAFVGPLTSSHVEDDFSVESCDLDFRSNSIAPVKRKPTWRFHRCRVWGEPPKNIPTMRFTECVVVSIYGIVAPADGTSSDYEFNNCLIRNNNYLLTIFDTGSHTLRLRNCTFYSIAAGHSRLAIMRDNAKLTVEATGNVFHCQSQANELIEPQSMPQVTWIGADNCFSGSWYQIWEGNVLKEKGLPAWNKLWKEPERDSREVNLLAFEWGRIQRLPNPERSLAIRAATDNLIAQHKLREVGPDWNLVGSGEAYVRALAAEGRAVPESELRPERREDGPIVLLRDGKEVRGFLTLKPALDAAQDQDVIELRTDGLVKDSRWTGDSRLLTIRAGAGYTPTIDDRLESSGTDRLILEGLTIRHVLQASGGAMNEKDFENRKLPLFPTQGSIVRMMNCTLLPETKKSISDAWLFGDGDSIPEIVNCDVGALRIGLRSGGTARLRNSVFADCRPNVESRTAQPGTLEIEHCAFWLPEPALNVWSASLKSLSPVTVQARQSLFVSPVDLASSQPQTIHWTGTGNVFVKSYGFAYGRGMFQLEQLPTDFQTEADSIELPPWEFDPAQWRILREKSPGYQPRPDGTDYGADIDRLVNTIARDAARPAIAPFDAKQAKVHQAAWAKHLGVPVEHTNSIGMKFVLIPPGEFTMGSTSAEIDEAVQAIGENEWENRFWQRCTLSEGPQHKVILTKPIYLGVHEVTQAEFETVMGNNPSAFASTADGRNRVVGLNTANHPVEKVSWNDAAEFCARLSQLEKLQPFYLRAGETVTALNGTGYRLPTEAQWEFACRAGTMTKFSHDERSETLESTAWLDRNSDRRTHAVGELKANPFGLHDMHGNIWEYVEDAWEQSYYEQFQNQPAIDPRGAPANGSHILRGGHWRSLASICRASSRTASTLAILHIQNCAGFRVALTVDAVKAAIAERTRQK